MRELIIIGAGPAGLSAAIYAKRQNIDVLILEKSSPGGQVVNTFEVENYIGVGRVNGADLALKMHTDAMSFGVDYEYADVSKIENHNEGFKITTDMGVFEAKSVIVATGTKPRVLNVKNEDKFSYRGISWCAICDGHFYKNKDVLVFGAGNSAVEEATYLAGIASKVTLIARSHIKSSAVAEQKLRSLANVEILEECETLEFLGEDVLEGVLVKHLGELKTINASGAFEYVGLIPNSNLLSELIDLDEGYVNTNEEMETSVKGLYVVGDVRKKSLRQIVTAVSDGAIAAIKASKCIKE